MRTVNVFHNNELIAQCTLTEATGVVVCQAESGGESFVRALTAKGVPDESGTVRHPHDGAVFLDALLTHYRNAHWLATEA